MVVAAKKIGKKSQGSSREEPQQRKSHALRPYFTGGPCCVHVAVPGLRDPSSRMSSFGVAGRPLGILPPQPCTVTLVETSAPPVAGLIDVTVGVDTEV